VAGGIDRVPHVFASFVNGWPALKRGCYRAVLECHLGTLGGAMLTYLGFLARPVLAPLALRPTPLPRNTKLTMAGLGATAALAAWLLRQRS
jgi:hypothetical protein